MDAGNTGRSAGRTVPSARRGGPSLRRAWALAWAGLVVLAGCAIPRQEPSRWPAVEPTDQGAGSALRQVHVAVDPALAPLARALEPIYERQHPDVDLVLHEGARTGRLDQAQWLALRLDRGAQADAYLAESVQTVRDRTRTPAGWAPWLGNTLVVVAPRGVGVPASALGDRTTPVHLALERTALGRWTRAALRQAGLWDEVAPTAGLFDNGRAIVQRLHESAQRDPPRPALGIVLGSDADPARVEIVGRLAPPADDPPVHAVAWLTQAGEDLASWLRHDPSARRTALAMGFLLPGPTLPDADGSAPTTPQPRAHPRGQPVLPPAGPALPAGGQR